MTANADQIAYWNEVVGAKWVRAQPDLDRLMAPLTEALLEAIAPLAGDRVLDIGCGCGDLALRLAEAVGRRGEITAIDVSAPMLAHAARRAIDLRTDTAPIEWRQADASRERFSPDRTCLASRFGVMFFDDRAAAFANLRTALAPGGRFAFLTWRGRAEVAWMQAPLDWIAPVLPMAVDTTPGDVGPFALADSEATIHLLAEAGFQSVEATRLDRTLTIGATLEEAATLLSHTGPAAAAMRDSDPASVAAAGTLLREGLARHAAADGSIHLGGACWIYTGRA